MLQISHDKDISITDVLAVANGAKVSLAAKTRSMLLERREQIVSKVKTSATPAYGFNRGFGRNVDVAVGNDELAALQQSFIRSHSCGVGEPASKEIVRVTMFLRAKSLAQGFSGVRPELVEKLIEFLNADIVPIVPSFGSVGASGDLAPLSHVGLSLIGEGNCTIGDSKTVIPTSDAIKKAGLKPISLEMKEGLALANGVQFSTAYGVIACDMMRKFIRTAAINSALSAQILLGSDEPFRKDLHALRPHKGAQIIAGWIWDLMQNSPLRNFHRDYDVDGEIQDPYNLRCAAQILGSCYDLIENAASAFEIEINSVTDNPLILKNESGNEHTTVVSGGHFHGMPIAINIYNLVQSISIMARLSNMRCVRIVDAARNNGLGRDLLWPHLDQRTRSISSGMMIPEYVSAALTNALWGESMPSHLFSLSTNSGQEDHVSMSAGLGARLMEMLPKLSQILAIELAYLHQAKSIREERATIPSKIPVNDDAEIKKSISELKKVMSKKLPENVEPIVHLRMDMKIQENERKLNPVSEEILKWVGNYFPVVKGDRELSSSLGALSCALHSGEILKIAEKHIPFKEVVN